MAGTGGCGSMGMAHDGRGRAAEQETDGTAATIRPRMPATLTPARALRNSKCTACGQDTEDVVLAGDYLSGTSVLLRAALRAAKLICQSASRRPPAGWNASTCSRLSAWVNW